MKKGTYAKSFFEKNNKANISSRIKMDLEFAWKHTQFFLGKFVAVPSGGPASRGVAVKNGDDGGTGHTLRKNVSKTKRMCRVSNPNHCI